MDHILFQTFKIILNILLEKSTAIFIISFISSFEIIKVVVAEPHFFIEAAAVIANVVIFLILSYFLIWSLIGWSQNFLPSMNTL